MEEQSAIQIQIECALVLFIFFLGFLSGVGRPAEQWFKAQCKLSALTKTYNAASCPLVLLCCCMAAGGNLNGFCVMGLLCDGAAGAALTALQALTAAPFTGTIHGHHSWQHLWATFIGTIHGHF